MLVQPTYWSTWWPQIVASILLYHMLSTLQFMKDSDECLEEVTIIAFPPMPGIGIVEEDPIGEAEDSCGDASPVQVPLTSSSSPDEIVINIGTKDPMKRINQLLEKARERFGNSICIRVAAYDTVEEIEEATEWLNAALRGSGQAALLDRHEFSAFVGASAPILSINNRLSFIGITPNESQFLSRIAASLRIARQE